MLLNICLYCVPCIRTYLFAVLHHLNKELKWDQNRAESWRRIENPVEKTFQGKTIAINKEQKRQIKNKYKILTREPAAQKQ